MIKTIYTAPSASAAVEHREDAISAYSLQSQDIDLAALPFFVLQRAELMFIAQVADIELHAHMSQHTLDRCQAISDYQRDEFDQLVRLHEASLTHAHQSTESTK